MLNPRHKPASLVFRLALAVGLFGSVLQGCGRSLPVGIERAPAEQGAATASSYYKPVAALMGKPLLKGLHRLVKDQKELDYGRARDHMFQTIDDPDGDDVVRDVYTGKKVPGVVDRTTAFHRGLNTEHSWPQSLGAKTGPAKFDLHHLFPTDAGANSQRNNLPFGEVTGEGVTLPDYAGDGLNSRVGQGAAGMVFEPRDDHKGDVARAMFYFYTRYVVESKQKDWPSTQNFRVEHDTLLRWHQQDPVSAYEKARNEAIYKVQRNRNPYVDHPEFVKKVGRFL